jgi:hypothetical protein
MGCHIKTLSALISHLARLCFLLEEIERLRSIAKGSPSLSRPICDSDDHSAEVDGLDAIGEAAKELIGQVAQGREGANAAYRRRGHGLALALDEGACLPCPALRAMVLGAPREANP